MLASGGPVLQRKTFSLGLMLPKDTFTRRVIRWPNLTSNYCAKEFISLRRLSIVEVGMRSVDMMSSEYLCNTFQIMHAQSGRSMTYMNISPFCLGSLRQGWLRSSSLPAFVLLTLLKGLQVLV